MISAKTVLLAELTKAPASNILNKRESARGTLPDCYAEGTLLPLLPFSTLLAKEMLFLPNSSKS